MMNRRCPCALSSPLRLWPPSPSPRSRKASRRVRPPASARPRPPPAAKRPPGAQQQPQPPEPPPIFLCRTAEEVCTLGIVTGNNQIVVIFTNAPGAEGVAKPIDVSSGDGSPLDLSQNMGRVVLLTGAYDPKTGLTKAELVEA